MPIFESNCEYPVPVEELFGWHARPGALQRLTPPWQPARVLSQSGGIQAGARVELVLSLGPVPVRWTALHTEYTENRHFRDVQVWGPFAQWVHDHRFEPISTGSRLTDRVEYRLRFGALGQLAGGGFARRELERGFRYRHRLLGYDLARHARFREQGTRSCRISGSWAPLAAALAAFLGTGGHSVQRSEAGPADAALHLIGPGDDPGLDAVIRGLAGSTEPPGVLVIAAPEAGADAAARLWELTTPARAAGIRTVLLRVTPVLGAPADRPGPHGWIAQEDVIGIIHHALFTDSLSGLVAAAAPACVEEPLLRETGFQYLFTDPDHARRLVAGSL